MKRVAIVQARTGSTRLPGKILMDLEGQPVLARVLERIRAARLIDDVVVATTHQPQDDAVVALARKLDTRVFRGSEDDVLSRYVGAARVSGADLVVRITSDCPLVDPEVLDTVVAALQAGDSGGAVDYASNVIERTYPRGLDVEAFYLDVLERMDRLARSMPAREHVTYFLLNERPDLFRCRSVRDVEDNSTLRWTVDEMADLEAVRIIFRELRLAAQVRSYREIALWVTEHPAVAAMNMHVRQKA